MYLSCTKGDRRSGLRGFVLGINSQLVEINSNRCLSRIVRNLASSNIVVIVLWNMMVHMNMELLYGYGYYCMILNDIPHVWHRLVANLDINSHN